MRKVIGIAALGVIVVAVGIVWWAYSNLDSLVKDAIERYGSEAAGTPVEVSSVSLKLGLDEAGGTLEGLVVKNPAGFPAGNALRFGRVEIEIEPSSISQSPVVIRSIRLLDPEVNYILNQEQKSNFGVIREHLGKQSSGLESGSGGEPVRILIKEFSLGAGKVKAQLEAVGGEPLELDLPAASEKNLGSPNGLPPRDLARTILQRVSRRVMAAAADQTLRRLIEEKFGTDAGGAVDKLLKSIRKP